MVAEKHITDVRTFGRVRPLLPQVAFRRLSEVPQKINAICYHMHYERITTPTTCTVNKVMNNLWYNANRIETSTNKNSFYPP
jgi:hypothetical protein